MTTKDFEKQLPGRTPFYTDAKIKFIKECDAMTDSQIENIGNSNGLSAEEKEACISDINEIRSGFHRGMECMQCIH